MPQNDNNSKAVSQLTLKERHKADQNELGLPELYRRRGFSQKSFDLLWKFRDAISWKSASVMKGPVKN